MLVYKICWLNYDKQRWEGEGEHEKEKNMQRWFAVPQLIVTETVGFYLCDTSLAAKNEKPSERLREK